MTVLSAPPASAAEPSDTVGHVQPSDPAIPTTEPGEFVCGLNNVINYDPLMSITTYYRNCMGVGRELRIWLYPNQMPLDEWEPMCVAPNSTRVLVGPRYPELGPFPGMFNGVFVGGTCTDYGPPHPQDRVTGQVTAPRRAGTEVVNPLAGARWEMWYQGPCSGQATDPVEWCPVLGEVDANNRPVGDHVAGYLDGEGRFSDGGDGIGFVYPQTYTLEDGTRWHGCAEAQPPVPHLLGNACAEDALVLRVFPVNQDRSIVVRDRDNDYPDDIAPLTTIPLGLHFLNAGSRQSVHLATSPGAHAYSGALNARRFYPMSADIRLNDRDINQYEEADGVVQLNFDRAEHSSVEHELGHRWMHLVYGRLPRMEDCLNHSFTAKLANETCSLVEGFAEFFAVIAENDPGQTSLFLRTSAGFSHDLERCALLDGETTYGCHDGRLVEGRVAGALYDLVDDTPAEWRDGKRDDSAASITAVLGVFADSKPKTFAEFWTAWQETHGVPADQETMWANTLVYTGSFDASHEDVGSGSWFSAGCVVADRCAGAELIASEPVEGQSPSLTWNIAPAALSGISEGHTVWDIWVRIPPASPDIGGDLETAAIYEVETKHGRLSWSVDQRGAAGTWVQLRPDDGFALDPSDRFIALTLRQPVGHEKAVLVADGVVVVPRG